jgi:hypothetical protein
MAAIASTQRRNRIERPRTRFQHDPAADANTQAVESRQPIAIMSLAA